MKPPISTVYSDRTVVNRDLVACHEAAHATMRWIERLPATELTVADNGGLCEGSGRPMPADTLALVALAGIAFELWYDPVGVSLNSPFDDLQYTRELLERNPTYCIGVRDGVPRILSVEDVMGDLLEKACNKLEPHDQFVVELGLRLAAKGRLSAEEVASQLMKYEGTSRRTAGAGG
jgi:hypothetical protein